MVQTCKIKGTNRLIDNLIRPDHFRVKPQFRELGDPKDEQTLKRLQEFFQDRQNLSPEIADSVERQEIPLPQVSLSHFPSQPQAHTVVRDTPLEAWQELLFVISRFGHPVKLAKGERLELQNLKVVVTRPVFESEEALRKHHFDPEKLRTYQRDFLRGKKGPTKRIVTAIACAPISGRIIWRPACGVYRTTRRTARPTSPCGITAGIWQCPRASRVSSPSFAGVLTGSLP